MAKKKPKTETEKEKTEKEATSTAKKPTRYRPKIYFKEGSSKTKQSFKNECDINLIVNKFKATGVITHQNNQPAQYGYAPEIDFREALQTVMEAEESFGKLPAAVRQRFMNDPAELIDFLGDPENRDEAVELGLMEAPEAVAGSPRTPMDANPDKGPENAPETVSEGNTD